MKKFAILAIALILLPSVLYANTVIKDGDPGFFVQFSTALAQVVPGEVYCDYAAPANFGFANTTCTLDDTFCFHFSDQLGWAIEGVTYAEGEAFELGSGSYFWADVCITVPCEATIGTVNTWTWVFAYTDVDGVCQPDSGDCPEPTVYSGVPRPSTITMDLEVVTAPPALYILQDTLYLVEQGQTAAYIPFSICNGDPCAPPTSYDYNIKSTGVVGPAIDQSGTAANVPGGECQDVYGVIDAGEANVCDYDELTIVVWRQDGSVYDTCVQEIHVVEPVPVPLFTTPVVTILVLAMILAAAVIMKRTAISKA